MKEILKIRCQIYILMMKVIILRKIQAALKTFAPPFFSHLAWTEKTCDNESHEKETTEAVVNFTRKRLKVCNFIKRRLQHRCFLVKFAKFLRTPFFTEHLRWLLLKLNILMLQLQIYNILEQEVLTGMRAMRKKLNIFMLQLPLYYILE